MKRIIVATFRLFNAYVMYNCIIYQRSALVFVFVNCLNELFGYLASSVQFTRCQWLMYVLCVRGRDEVPVQRAGGASAQ